MAETQNFDSSQDNQDLVMRWMAAGHEVVHERSTFRHKAYKKEFDKHTPVTQDGAQLIMSNGHALVAGDILPERADLALDMDGCVLPQHEFEKRYREYLNWFTMVEGSDPSAEYVPNAVQYISQTPDTFSESPGMVEIGFDASKPAEEERTHRYDPERDEMVEVMKTQGDALAKTVEALTQVMSERTPDPPKRGPGRPRKEESA